MTAQPFPYDALPALSRREVRTLERLRRTLLAIAKPEELAQGLGEIAGEPVRMTVRRALPLEATRVPAMGAGVLFSASDSATPAGEIFVDAETALAANLVARALRQRAPRIVDGGRPASPELAGAMAAVLHGAFRKAHRGVPLRVVAAGPSVDLVREFGSAHAHVATIWLAVELGGHLYDARISVPMARLPPPPNLELFSDSIPRFAAAPVALPLVVASCLAGRDTLAALRPGDVFVIPEFPLRAEAGALIGPIAVVAPRSERALVGELAEGGRLVLRTERVEHRSWSLDIAAMTESTATLQVLEDAPVVVRVELGAVEMKASEWASLTTGDVITLGRQLGDPAVLRIAGVEVARGELVQVDGEYGVRILR